MLRLGTNLPYPIGSVRDLDGGKTARVEDLIGEGRKPDIDDGDAPIHSVLGVEGTTDHLTRASDQDIGQEGQRPSGHRTFCIRFVLL